MRARVVAASAPLAVVPYIRFEEPAHRVRRTRLHPSDRNRGLRNVRAHREELSRPKRGGTGGSIGPDGVCK